MTCEEVRALLVDYLDKALDTPTTTRVATHLISCAPCGVQAGELADCVSQVAALPALEPPLGFAQRVMAHVREIEPKPSLWERLLLPWSNNIPLRATSLVIVGIIAVVLYQKEDSLKPTQLKSMSQSASVESANSIDQSNPPVTKRTNQKIEPSRQAPIALAKRVEPAPERMPASAPPAEPSPGRKSDLEARLDENKITRRAPIQVQEASSPSEASRLTFGTGFSPSIPFGGLRQAAPRPAPMALERLIPLGERVADYEFVVRRRPPQRHELGDSISAESTQKSAESDNVTRAAAPATASPRIESIAEIRFYSVAPEHFEFFKKELASEAIVESEAKPAAKETEAARYDRQLLIKVTILPASAESAVPPR